ncbi:potassium channel family protein [Pseudonocardia sp. NPDC049154]|uniref:potassium channel family protein n=1 Tax=Pseudonocardia sp. NPDC049154 TaxID=3155501 RepID=UPI0033E949AF
MSTAPTESLSAAQRRRLVAIGLLRALATTVLVIAAYYLLPLNKLTGISLGVALAVGILALTALVVFQVRAIIRHRHAALRAIEALAITVPVFVLLFAATYFMMEQGNPDNFNVDSLTRTDSLYFTVTVFATVGFGDITATSQAARVVVIAQMILDLLVLGLVVKVFLGAVEINRGRQTTQQDPEPPS